MKLVRLLEGGECGQEVQFPGSVQGVEGFQEQAPEQAREHANRKEKSALAGNPTLAIWRRPAARYDAVHMRMMLEVLAPAMQHGGDADVGAEVLGVGRNGGERLRCGRRRDP